MTSPTLKSARLTLAFPLVHEGMDLTPYLKWLCNETVTKYSDQRHVVHTPETQYKYITSFVGSEDYFWEIRRNATPIGSIVAYRDIPNRTANVGIMIGEPSVWGQGYGPEAWDTVCNFLFSQGTRKIEAGCMASNHGMRRLLEKVGFVYEATIDNHFLLYGNPENKVCYGKYSKAKIIQIKGHSCSNLA